MRNWLLTMIIRRCPWRVLEWATERYGLCWANIVIIKLGHSDAEGGLRPSGLCWGGFPGPAYDYCGRYRTAQEFRAASGLEVPAHKEETMP